MDRCMVIKLQEAKGCVWNSLDWSEEVSGLEIELKVFPLLIYKNQFIIFIRNTNHTNC
jgi:hypothetical protein